MLSFHSELKPVVGGKPTLWAETVVSFFSPPILCFVLRRESKRGVKKNLGQESSDLPTGLLAWHFHFPCVYLTFKVYAFPPGVL